MSSVRLSVSETDRRRRVPCDVGERLLSDAVERHTLRWVEVDRCQVDGHLDLLAALHRRHEMPEQLVQIDLDELLRTKLQQQRAHLRLGTARQRPQALQPPVQLGTDLHVAQHAVGGQRRRPERLVDGVVELS